MDRRELYEYIQEKQPNICQISVLQNGNEIYAALGNSGNVIYVDPDRKIVAAVSAYFKPTVFDRVDFIEDVLLPVLQPLT